MVHLPWIINLDNHFLDRSSTEVKGHQQEATEGDTTIRDKEQDVVYSDRMDFLFVIAAAKKDTYKVDVE